jgi:hypothetical protein
MQVSLGFWPAKTLLSAVELGVFTELAKGPRRRDELGEALGLHPRGSKDLFDALVAIGCLEKEGRGEDALYRNNEMTDFYLDRAKESYIGGFLEMANARLYRYWGDLTEGLRTGKPQNEVKHTGTSIFEALYQDPAGLEGFMNAMQGISLPNFEAFAEKFDFSKYETLCDVGGANALLARTVAKRHPHLKCTSWDLPPVEPIARKAVASAGLGDRVQPKSGDFFKDALPKADVVTMGMILHDWNLDHKRMLIGKAYDALPDGGAFVVIENLIDDDRRENVIGLMMSLNMLIEFGDAFDFTGEDFSSWCKDAGFRKTEVIPLRGPASAGVAYK